MNNLMLWLIIKLKRKWYHPVPWLGITNRLSRHEERLKLISNNMPQKRCSILDIGSNTGFYSFKLAEAGHFVTALDTHKNALFMLLLKKKIGLNNIIPSSLKLNPDNTPLLPKYDVILCLSLMRHLCKDYGIPSAFTMLGVLIKKCDVMFFDMTECSSDTPEFERKFRGILPDYGNKPHEGITHYFNNRIQGTEKQVKIIGKVRGRHLFKIGE